jgi:hypothetical protein
MSARLAHEMSAGGVSWDTALDRRVDGRMIWSYNTVQEFKTVNGVQAKGGSMGAPGATVAGGMLFVGSWYII